MTRIYTIGAALIISLTFALFAKWRFDIFENHAYNRGHAVASQACADERQRALNAANETLAKQREQTRAAEIASVAKTEWFENQMKARQNEYTRATASLRACTLDSELVRLLNSDTTDARASRKP